MRLYDESLADGPLEELRHHWGSAYDIGFERGRWAAQRKDGNGTPLTDSLPGGLREKITADYLASPVPRDLPLDTARTSLRISAGPAKP